MGDLVKMARNVGQKQADAMRWNAIGQGVGNVGSSLAAALQQRQQDQAAEQMGADLGIQPQVARQLGPENLLKFLIQERTQKSYLDRQDALQNQILERQKSMLAERDAMENREEQERQKQNRLFLEGYLDPVAQKPFDPGVGGTMPPTIQNAQIAQENQGLQARAKQREALIGALSSGSLSAGISSALLEDYMGPKPVDEPAQIQTLRLLQANPELMETYRQMHPGPGSGSDEPASVRFLRALQEDPSLAETYNSLHFTDEDRAESTKYKGLLEDERRVSQDLDDVIAEIRDIRFSPVAKPDSAARLEALETERRELEAEQTRRRNASRSYLERGSTESDVNREPLPGEWEEITERPAGSRPIPTDILDELKRRQARGEYIGRFLEILEDNGHDVSEFR
jgi:hypothetical protein